MKGILKLIDFNETPNVGDDIIRNFHGRRFHELWTKKSEPYKEGQEGNIQKLVVFTEEHTYKVESHNWTLYLNQAILGVEKEYVVKTIGDNIYVILFGEEKFEMDVLQHIKKEYDEIIKKYPSLTNNERLYTEKEVAYLPLLLCTEIGVHAKTISDCFVEWKTQFEK